MVALCFVVLCSYFFSGVYIIESSQKENVQAAMLVGWSVVRRQPVPVRTEGMHPSSM